MVNRRLLRVKAMKALYAFKQAERSDFELVLDYIDEQFQPDLNSMEVQDTRKLEGFRKLAKIEFEERLSGKMHEVDVELPVEVKEVVRKAVHIYKEKCIQEKKKISKDVVDEVELLYVQYIQMLLLINLLAEMAKNDEESRLLKTDEVNYALFSKNKVCEILRNSDELNLKRIKHEADWKTEHLLIVRQFYKDVLRPNESFIAYCSKVNHTFEEDADIVYHIIRNLVMKGDLMKQFFEDKDINWLENSNVIKSLVQKTIKVDQANEVKLQRLAHNWDEDRKYFTDLFSKGFDHEKEYEPIILGYVKNWEEERIALMDMIILKLGITELVHFSSIPVKVTINEYIELAKTYSTPQSGKFVNGVLDMLAINWQKEGKIKKSGRGLIDNR